MFAGLGILCLGKRPVFIPPLPPYPVRHPLPFSRLSPPPTSFSFNPLPHSPSLLVSPTPCRNRMRFIFSAESIDQLYDLKRLAFHFWKLNVQDIEAHPKRESRYANARYELKLRGIRSDRSAFRDFIDRGGTSKTLKFFEEQGKRRKRVAYTAHVSYETFRNFATFSRETRARYTDKV